MKRLFAGVLALVLLCSPMVTSLAVQHGNMLQEAAELRKAKKENFLFVFKVSNLICDETFWDSDPVFREAFLQEFGDKKSCQLDLLKNFLLERSKRLREARAACGDVARESMTLEEQVCVYGKLDEQEREEFAMMREMFDDVETAEELEERILGTSPYDPQPEGVLPEPVEEESLTNEEMTQLATHAPMLGDTSAPVTIVEFTDYECPYCARHHTDVFPLIQTNYIDTEKVRYVARDFPLGFHSMAESAAVAARCAGDQGDDETYFDYADLLFSGESFTEELFVDYARDLNLDIADFNSCYEDYDTSGIASDIDLGTMFDVTGTPAFILFHEDGRYEMIEGAYPYDEFERVIEELLGE